MKAFFITLLAVLTFSYSEAQERKITFRLYHKDGKELKRQQVDSLEAIYKKLNFEFNNSADSILVIVNIPNEKDSLNNKNAFQFKISREKDGSYKTSFVGDSALREKWVGQKIFKANLKDVEGNSYTLGGKSDHVIVLNLWYTACGPCVKEMPDLNELVAEFSNSKVDFLALTFDSQEKVNKFLAKKKFDYQIIPDVKEQLAKVWVRSDDETQSISTIYPVHFVIDQEGVVQEMILGAKENIRELLRESIQSQL